MARGLREQRVRFADIVEALLETRAGQEASMYPRIFQLFVHFLGYQGRQVLTDTAGDAGRPDLTCRAPNGLSDASGRSIEIDWIVVEAKDQRYGLSLPENREKLFEEKSKYITPNTAWFVMIGSNGHTESEFRENDGIRYTGALILTRLKRVPYPFKAKQVGIIPASTHGVGTAPV